MLLFLSIPFRSLYRSQFIDKLKISAEMIAKKKNTISEITDPNLTQPDIGGST